VPIPFPWTFATLSKFHLNTKKSANTKVVCVFKGHNFHKWRHLRFWVDDMLKLCQRQHLHACRTEKDINFTSSLCLNYSSNTRWPFANIVARCFLYNFSIGRIWTYIWKFWVWANSTGLNRIDGTYFTLRPVPTGTHARRGLSLGPAGEAAGQPRGWVGALGRASVPGPPFHRRPLRLLTFPNVITGFVSQ
jgi:hypothetical protein